MAREIAGGCLVRTAKVATMESVIPLGVFEGDDYGYEILFSPRQHFSSHKDRLSTLVL